MPLSIDKPVVCPAVIGRDDEIAILEQALTQVRGGRGQTILIAGEAGVGKSRLIAAARSRADWLLKAGKLPGIYGGTRAGWRIRRADLLMWHTNQPPKETK